MHCTTGIQSGPYAWEGSRLYSFILVLGEKADKEIPDPSRWEFSEKILANNSAPYQMEKTAPQNY